MEPHGLGKTSTNPAEKSTWVSVKNVSLRKRSSKRGAPTAYVLIIAFTMRYTHSMKRPVIEAVMAI